MQDLPSIDPNLPEVEIVYELLKSSQNKGKKLRELLEQAFMIKGIPLDDHQRMAAVHTELIMDNRFTSLGQGIWGLKEWNQEKIVRRFVPRSGLLSHPFRRRSLLEEIENEENEDSGKFTDLSFTDDEEWEE